MQSACARFIIACLEILVARRRYKREMHAQECESRVSSSGMHSTVLRHTLGGNASIDPLVKGTILGRKRSEFPLVLLEHLLIVGSQALNLVNVLHLRVDKDSEV